MELSILPILVFTSLLLFFALVHSHSSNTTMLFQCHEKERSALLEFKATFYDVSCNHSPYRNLKTWMVEGKNRDCCSWDGIECDEHSRHVIGLNLSYSCLSGSITSTSSIFGLFHLERLDLSSNDFHYSKIPSAIGNLSRLASLKLSDSGFAGQIPSEILNLTNLSLLDLSNNQLALTNPSLKDLAQTLTKLEELYLERVNIPSSLPDSILRLSSLKSLSLCNCGLQGPIPLHVANFVLVGDITSSIWNLTQLQFLDLSHNELTGEILPQLLSSTRLVYINLSFNKFYGQIPTTISHLENLSAFYISSNNFSGKTYLDMFFKLENLYGLDLAFNNFSLIIKPTINSCQRLAFLVLASCNLIDFPKFLRGQNSLKYLDLSSNNIFGEVPEWFLYVSTKELLYLNLSHNHLTGFKKKLPLLKWNQLKTLDLRFNEMKGSLPSLSNTSSLYYLVSNNEFSGEIPASLCNLVNLNVLDLGNNNLSGKIPPCLADLVGVGNLLVLSLQSNNFEGRIHQLGKDRCNLVMIDMSYNQLEGPIPRDLENCINVRFLNLEHNKIDDVFPFWLGKLPALGVLILDSNKFYGIIEKPKGDHHFPKLQIIRLSGNEFIGSLPSLYFSGWNAMKVDPNEEGRLQYWGTTMDKYYHGNCYFSFGMVNKGILMEYKKVQKPLVVIDLSSNNFTREIPESIGNLRGLYLLNLSNNMLNGSNPFNLDGLTNLEILDLSHNKLSGDIPQQLTGLTSLSSYDVSFNQLTGRIPSSKQFNTFESSSYEGNSGLCGFPLSMKCGNIVEASPLPSLEKEQTSKTLIGIDWKITFMGYISGFVIGLVIGMNWTREYKIVKSASQIKFILN